MIFIYINEFMTSMLRSQLFFSAGEIFSTFVLLYHANRNNSIHKLLLNIAAGNAIFHIVQMFADEQKNLIVPRNIVFLIGDISILLFVVSLTSFKERRPWTIRVFIAMCEFGLFQLFFGDTHSFSLFSS